MLSTVKRACRCLAAHDLRAAEWPQFAQRLTALGERLADDGLDLVYHHHMGTVVESAEDIHCLMEMSGKAVHLLLDTGHLTFAGADPVEFARTYKDRIRHVHAKDVRADVFEAVKAKDESFLDAVVDGVYTVPGDGMVDYHAVFAALQGYSGWVVVEAEQDPRGKSAGLCEYGIPKLEAVLEGSPAHLNRRGACRRGVAA